MISSEFLFKFLSRVRLFQLIWSEILHNGRKSRSKVLLNDITTILLVIGRVFCDTLYIKNFLNYVEKSTTIRQWHTKLGTTTKNIEYLGVILIHLKKVKYGCKGFSKNQKEAQYLKRGCCIQGKINWFMCGFLLPFIELIPYNACVIHTS